MVEPVGQVEVVTEQVEMVFVSVVTDQTPLFVMVISKTTQCEHGSWVRTDWTVFFNRIEGCSIACKLEN